MDKSEPSEANDSNSNDEPDNRLTNYMVINRELSKSIVTLKTENAGLRNQNNLISKENLSLRNELTSNQKEIMKWRKKFSKLQTMHIEHVETLTCELQSYADKLNAVFINSDETEENCEAKEDEVTSQITTERDSTSSTVADNSRRVSRSFESPKADVKLPERSDDNPSNLHTIAEENEEVNQTNNMEQISHITSTYEATLANHVDSNKENERPSGPFTNSNSTHEESESTIRENETSLQFTMKSPANTPLKDKFITKRRGSRSRLQTNENNSFEIMKTPELVSSTPYKRKTTSISTKEVENTISTRSSTSKVLGNRTSTSFSGRPKRKASPVDFAEPKLNTKLRRPRT